MDFLAYFHTGKPVLRQSGDDILANLVNDSFYVSLLKYVESMANILKADYIEYASLLFLSANEIHRRQEFVLFPFIVFAF